MEIHSLVFALSRQINKQKYAKTIHFLCAGNKVFVKYQAQGGVVNPKPPRLRTPLSLTHLNYFIFFLHRGVQLVYMAGKIS